MLNLQSKSMGWFLYDLRHERVKGCNSLREAFDMNVEKKYRSSILDRLFLKFAVVTNAKANTNTKSNTFPLKSTRNISFMRCYNSRDYR